MENYETYNYENSNSGNVTTNNGTVGNESQSSTSTQTMKDRVANTLQNQKEVLRQQTSKLSEQLNNRFDNVRVRASEGLESASNGINRFASYIKENDSSAMWSGMQSTIRNNGVFSMILGLGLGVLIGRALR